MENLGIYNATRKVPDIACKQFDNGSFKGTDINPMWRIKTLTEQFGPCGIGWYYEVLSERSEQYGETVMAIVDLNLYIKVNGEWSKPIYGTGGNALVKVTKAGARPSDEGYKMALTDALSVACKALGIGADVYFEKDKTKYTAAQKEINADDSEPAFPVCDECGRPIKGITTDKGTTSAEEIAARTKKTYGKCLCYECAALAKKATA